MDDLISRQDVIKAVLLSNFSACTVYGRSEEGMATAKELIQAIKNLPSAQTERKKGKWRCSDAFPHWLYCDQCYKRIVPNMNWIEEYNIPTNYCPNCGARMRGEDDGE